MPLLSPRPVVPGPLRQRPRGIRRWVIPALGAVTPVGLIVVNISVFIEKHLLAFRWTIAILAFVSGMMLNSWIGLKIYRLIQKRFRDSFLVSEINQDLVLIGGMTVIIAVSFVTALFCYLGLSSEANLPNATTLLTGILAILVPVTLQFIFERVLGGRPASGEGQLPVKPAARSQLPPPPPPPLPRPSQQGAEHRR